MLDILHYHLVTTEYFKQQEKLWQFFAHHTYKEDHLKSFKIDLLKNTYQFEESADPELFKKVQAAKEKLNLSLPVFLYQAQNTEDMNATIAYINNEAHIVFSGKILQFLNEEEVQAIIAHELSHVQLYCQAGGEVEITDRIMNAISNHYSCTPPYYETARLFKLYTEIFCDRGAYLVTGNCDAIITSLVKISTGLQKVNAESYIKQAEEIFSLESETKTMGFSHPENFIRARAIWLWHSKNNEADAEIKKMIEGNINIEELDLFKQKHISEITERLIKLILHPEWMQTEQTLALAKQYFPNFTLKQIPDKIELKDHLEHLHSTLSEYFSYIMYDFISADKNLEDIPLGYCFYMAEELKLDNALAATVKKERKLSEKKVAALKKQSVFEYLNMTSASLA